MTDDAITVQYEKYVRGTRLWRVVWWPRAVADRCGSEESVVDAVERVGVKEGHIR